MIHVLPTFDQPPVTINVNMGGGQVCHGCSRGGWPGRSRRLAGGAVPACVPPYTLPRHQPAHDGPEAAYAAAEADDWGTAGFRFATPGLPPGGQPPYIPFHSRPGPSGGS